MLGIGGWWANLRSGRVVQIDAILGQSVKKGDILARLNSSELSSQQLAYLKARAELELNRRNAERAKLLFDSDVIAAAELQRKRMLLFIEGEMPRDIAMQQRAGRHHLGVQARMRREQAMKKPAMAIGPVHHRSDAQPPGRAVVGLLIQINGLHAFFRDRHVLNLA